VQKERELLEFKKVRLSGALARASFFSFKRGETALKVDEDVYEKSSESSKDESESGSGSESESSSSSSGDIDIQNQNGLDESQTT